jgi:hypothetical protein
VRHLVINTDDWDFVRSEFNRRDERELPDTLAKFTLIVTRLHSDRVDGAAEEAFQRHFFRSLDRLPNLRFLALRINPWDSKGKPGLRREILGFPKLP